MLIYEPCQKHPQAHHPILFRAEENRPRLVPRPKDNGHHLQVVPGKGKLHCQMKIKCMCTLCSDIDRYNVDN